MGEDGGGVLVFAVGVEGPEVCVNFFSSRPLDGGGGSLLFGGIIGNIISKTQ